MPPPPPPPGPPPPPSFGGPSKSSKSGAPDRNQLLSSIRQGTTLKKTVTNDRSAPQLDGKPRSGGGGGVGGPPKPNSGGRQPLSRPDQSSASSVSSMNGGGPQLAGLFAGGMPTLKATGRGRLGPIPAPKSDSTSSSPNSSSTYEPSQPAWKRNNANSNSAFGTGSGSGAGVNRGPPPQPPPASRKPTLLPSDSGGVDQSSSGERGGRFNNAPSLPSKPPVTSYGKPNIAPKPPVPESKYSSSSASVVSTHSRASTARAGFGANRSQPELTPPKSPSVTSLNPTSPPPPPTTAPAPPPPSSKPNISRAQSLRSVKGFTAAAAPETEGAADDYQNTGYASRSEDHYQNSDLPPPPPNRFATLPRSPMHSASSSRGALPGVPRSSASSMSSTATNGINSPGKTTARPPNVRLPPPPPQRLNPPPPPSNAPPPPPPPHRMNPAPLPPSAPSVVSMARMSPNPCSAPPPPQRNSSMRSNGSTTTLNTLNSAYVDEFEARFAERFHPIHHLPAPEKFTNCPKIYPTQQLANQGMKRQQAPQPPTRYNPATS